MDKYYVSKLTLPHSVSISAVKKQNTDITDFYLYSSMFFFKFTMPQDLRYAQLDAASNSMVFFEKNPKYLATVFSHLFSNFLFSWDSYFFEKIKFAGKGYRVTFRKKKKLMKFYFGHSHSTIMIFRNVKIKKPHKYKFIIFKNSFDKVKKLGIAITSIKPINVYTKRGIRKSRQLVFKRKSNKANF